MHFVFEDFDFDATRLELRRAGKPLKADALVLRLLRALVQRPGQLVSKRELIDEVWEGRAVSENVITVAMARLRKTLAGTGEGDGSRSERPFIQNVHGRGYRFVQPVAERSEPLPVLSADEAPSVEPSAFVGRSSVLERLRGSLQQAAAAHGSLCMVLGEAGIGKTRLVEELARAAEEAGFHVVWAHCQAGYAPPLWPFEQLLRGLSERLDGPEAEEAGRASSLAHLLAELDSLRALSRGEPQAGTAPGFDAAAKHRSFDAIARVLGQLGQHTPSLLVIDDLHWADAASFELLRFWVDRAARSRVLVLGTLRDPGDQLGKSRHLGEVLGHRNTQRVELGRLGEADVHSYVRSLLPEADPVLSRAVLHKSEGNPFFMVELTRVLCQTPHPDVESLRMPEAALVLLRQRVRALDADARGVLSSAAVIGRSFDLALLSQLLDQEPSAVMQQLDAALGSAVVAPVGEARTEFAFRHELLRDVLYESMSHAQLRDCHQRVALLLEQRSEGGAVQPASLLAHHFYSALPDSDPRKAVRYLMLAAETAIHGYAYVDAVRALGRAREALRLVPNASRRLGLALLMRQTLCARVCNAEEFQRLVRELIQQAEEQKAGEVLAQATLLLGPHPGFAAMAGSGAALHAALDLLAPEQDALRAALLSRLATLGPLAFDGPKARAQVEQSFQIARGSRVLAAQHTTCTARLYVMGGPEHAAVAAESAEELTRLCREHPEQLSVPPVLLDLNHTIRALQDGQLARSQQALERAEERARMIDSQELLWQAQRFRVLLRFNQGEGQDTPALLDQLHQRALREAIQGAPLLALHDRIVIGNRHKELGAEERARLGLDPDDPPVLWSLKLRVLARAGLHETAFGVLRHVAPAELAKLSNDRDYLGTLACLTRAVLDLGAPGEYAEALLPLLDRYPQHFGVHASFLCEGALSELSGLLLQRLGRLRAAQQKLELAVQASDRAGLGRCAAEARLALTLCREAARGV
ncbi:MAG TPA: AAA family ATPase [Polyangiales bacterium]